MIVGDQVDSASMTMCMATGKSSSTLSFIQSVTPGEYIEEFSFTVRPRNLTNKG